MAKFLMTTIQVNLVPNPSETWRRQHKLSLLKILPSQPFLGRHLGFHILLHNGVFFVAAHFFAAGLFWIRLELSPVINNASCVSIDSVAEVVLGS